MDIKSEYKATVKRENEIKRAIAEEMKQYQGLIDEATEESVDKYDEIEMAIELKSGIYQAETERMQAENKLIEWAREKVIDSPQFEEIKIVFEKGTKILKYRRKLIDLALRLA